MENKKNITILSIIFLLLAVLFFAKTGNFFVDFSRESYLPYQMINGEKLYKDIFIVYGPFGYIFNSILYFFSAKLYLLIIESHLLALSVLILFYFILNKFFTPKVSLVFSLVFTLVSIFSNSTFSFVLPYSYSTLWAVFGIYLALFCLLYNKKNILFLAIGLVFVCKFELFIPIFIASIGYLIYKKESFLKNITYISIFPVLCLVYFLINNITLDDFLKNSFYIKEMLNTNSLKYLYSGMGVFFNQEYFTYSLGLFIKTFFIFAISHFIYIIKKPYISYTTLIILLCFINLNFAFNLLIFFAIFITFIAIKKKLYTKEEAIFFAFSMILSLKSIFALNSLGYANFGYCILIFYTFLQLQKFVDKKWLINSIIIFFILNIITNLRFYFLEPKKITKTNIGYVSVKLNDYELFKITNEYIKKYIKNNENFIVLPEGQIFNLIHKKPYGFYNTTFTPLDFETFKEGNLTKQLQDNQTDYIIFYPRNTQDYGKQGICYDYAVDFCKYIMDNYTQVATLKKEKQVTIFKLKK